MNCSYSPQRVDRRRTTCRSHGLAAEEVMIIRQVSTFARRAARGLLLLAAGIASAQVPSAVPPRAIVFGPGNPMPGLANIPRMPHEVNPRAWPQPDYFAEALKLTTFRPGDRESSLPGQAASRLASARFVVLPVQTQAFGFSPQFRAIVGADLDRQLETAGVDASRQTDVASAYGPFVRRLDEARIDEAAGAHPGQNVVVLYLGHD
jgi:hypothetical protein